MYECTICGRITTDHIVVPISINRRREFAKIFRVDEKDFISLPRYRYLCANHFNTTDFYRDGYGRITSLRPTALPKKNFQHIPQRMSAATPIADVWDDVDFIGSQNISNIRNEFNIDYSRGRFSNNHGGFCNKTGRLGSSRGGYSNIPRPNILKSSTVSRISSDNINFDYSDYDPDIFEPPYSPPKAQKRKHVTEEDFIAEESSSPPNKKCAIAEIYNDEERPELVLINIERLKDIFTSCHQCKTILGKTEKKVNLIGTAGSVSYRCSKCPQSSLNWSTQNYIEGTKVYEGNALLSSAAQLTPVSFPTLKLLFNLSRISIFGSCRYKRTAKDIVWPVVHEAYSKEHIQMLQMLKDREGAVNLLMDGQYDSPGFCAMMCKVTAIDSESGYVVGLKTLQRTETENKSARMEVEGVRRIMNEMKENSIKVDCLTTDRNSGVTKMMDNQFKETKHKRDPWHMVKGITKDLKKEAKLKKKNPTLELFNPALKNHLWFSIVEAKGDGILCREYILSSLFHLIGCHTWKKGNMSNQLKTAMAKIIGKDKEKQNLFRQINPSKCSKFFQELKFEKITHCCHGPIDPNNKALYMNPVTKEYFYILLKLTADKFLKDVVHLSPDLATSKVENFNSVATGIYTPKKTYYPYESYSVRCYLAALHHNNNERSEKEKERTVLRNVIYPSKAKGGENVKKKVKSKAPITFKHDMITKCLEVFEKGKDILEKPAYPVIDKDKSIDEEAEEIDGFNSNDEDSEISSDEYFSDEDTVEIAEEEIPLQLETYASAKAAKSTSEESIIVDKCIQNEIIFSFKPPTEAFFNYVCQQLEIGIENYSLSPLLKMPFIKKIGKYFRRHNVLADGNCGYRALSYLLFGTEVYHWLIRRLVTLWRKTRKEEEGIVNWEIIKDQTAERSTLDETHLWMNDRDMIAVAKIFFVNVLNYTHQGVPTPRWRCYSPGRVNNFNQKLQYPCLCIYLEGAHFEAIVSVNQI